jgi:transposase
MPSKSYRPWNPFQAYLLPPSPQEWLPEDHLAYFVLEVVQGLDLSAIERVVRGKDPRGERPYAPQLMVALLLYGYCIGLFSSRRIANATYSDVAFRVIAGESHPHFTTVNQFRLDHHVVLAQLFVQVLRLCQKAGLVKLGHVALDGSKVQANASKHKAMSYERMKSEEARLRAEVENLLSRADAVDREEDDLYGVGQQAHDLPEELRRRETRLEMIRQAKAALEKEAACARAEELRAQARTQRQKAADESVDSVERKRAATRAQQSEDKADQLDPKDKDDPPGGGASSDLPAHRVPTTPEGLPAATAQRNFTDPESRIMKNNTGYLQGYNAQIAVDAESQVIVADAVTNQAPDQEHLEPMLDRIIENCDGRPQVATADSGYFSAGNVDACEGRGIDPYIAVSRKNEDEPAATNTDEPETPAQQAKRRMRDKLRTALGKATYARRKAIVEPVFGQIKEARGFRRFLLRGIAKVRSEWRLICATHNLLKLFRTWRSGKSTTCPILAPIAT